MCFLHDPNMPKRLVSSLIMKKASDYKWHIKWNQLVRYLSSSQNQPIFTKSTSSKQLTNVIIIITILIYITPVSVTLLTSAFMSVSCRTLETHRSSGSS